MTMPDQFDHDQLHPSGPGGSSSRRSFLTGGAKLLGAAALVGAAPAAFARRAYAEGAPDLGSIGYQLSWTKDYEFAGSYIADDRGYWTKEGIKVNLLSGGASATPPQQVVASGQAFVGSSQAVDVANLLVSDKIKLVIVGATWQKYGLNIMSRADDPIHTPADLIGKKIGTFPANASSWIPFLKINHIDRSKIKEVPASYDITPLVNGEIDGYQGYGTARISQLASKVKLDSMLLADYGFNPIAAAYTVKADALTDKAKRAQLVAFLKGEILGWQDICYGHQYSEATKLTLDKYGSDLGLVQNQEMAGIQGQMPFMLSANTTKHGLFYMSEAMIKSTQTVFDTTGVKVDAHDIVTNDVLDEIYDGKSRL